MQLEATTLESRRQDDHGKMVSLAYGQFAGRTKTRPTSEEGPCPVPAPRHNPLLTSPLHPVSLRRIVCRLCRAYLWAFVSKCFYSLVYRGQRVCGLEKVHLQMFPHERILLQFLNVRRNQRPRLLEGNFPRIQCPASLDPLFARQTIDVVRKPRSLSNTLARWDRH